MSGILDRARQFMLLNARLLERRLYEVCLEGAKPGRVGQAVRAYLNADGGLGHALEPDVRCAESQPLFAGIGLEALALAGCRDGALAESLCGYLASVARGNGFVALMNETALDSPHAAHWDRYTPEPGLNPTAELCGLLHFQGVRHEWLDRATEACVKEALACPPPEAHALRCVARLAEYMPDRAAAANLLDRIAETLPKASFYIPFAPVTAYGLTPLHFAPKPGSFGSAIFAKEQLAGHIEDLKAKQLEDGGWPIFWNAPSPAAEMEWRGRWTLEAVCCLAAYGAIR